VPDDLQGVVALALARLRMLVEVNERTLVATPRAALSGIEKARASGWGIAWDNLGASPDALALMPFVRPDVVKIDIGLAHEGFRGRAGSVVNAALAYAERNGASIMATGIETEAHLRTARGIGAVLGQGYHFGRPGALPVDTGAPHQPITLIRDYGPTDPLATPYDIFTGHREPTAATPAMIEALANQLEQRALIDPEPPVIIACLPGNCLVSGNSLAQLQLISRNAGFVAVVARQSPAFEIPGVRIVQLADDDPVRGEAAFAVVGPHFAALLTARTVPARSGADEFTMSYGLTYDRPVVERAARALLHRVTDGA
jgi:EAL domain-containing protein (putative c-di-GMP-specific phosphodiesterase class I)